MICKYQTLVFLLRALNLTHFPQEHEWCDILNKLSIIMSNRKFPSDKRKKEKSAECVTIFCADQDSTRTEI